MCRDGHVCIGSRENRGFHSDKETRDSGKEFVQIGPLPPKVALGEILSPPPPPEVAVVFPLSCASAGTIRGVGQALNPINHSYPLGLKPRKRDEADGGIDRAAHNEGFY